MKRFLLLIVVVLCILAFIFQGLPGLGAIIFFAVCLMIAPVVLQLFAGLIMFLFQMFFGIALLFIIPIVLIILIINLFS
ncbi:hypothetical protein [Macrococcoides bohemicum]|uniref:hypothetical protein n=1 Tax=Macrococcoides bohemicum TaxID=1903056 RepID=UPI00165D748E|nr:hypothetical protein [Macrococcus bohemicus]MBC9875598.1 hypothetical protein [Macrococcus bohemicus]